jgi:hypothetical protein
MAAAMAAIPGHRANELNLQMNLAVSWVDIEHDVLGMEARQVVADSVASITCGVTAATDLPPRITKLTLGWFPMPPGVQLLCLSQTSSGWQMKANRAMSSPYVGPLQTGLVGARRPVPTESKA